MVLFGYNWIYRDQTFSARITREMFVPGYKRVSKKKFKVKRSGESCLCRGFFVPAQNISASCSL